MIAGSAKGVRLAPVPPGVRPVSDRAREGIFSSLGDVAGLRVLDVFAGTGAMGIEALSRGAEHATFIERARRAAAAIAENLERTSFADRATVIVGDAARTVTTDGEIAGAAFDLVVLDPPYVGTADQVERILGALRTRLTRGARCVVTRATRGPEPTIPVHLALSRRLEYGDTAVLILREA